MKVVHSWRGYWLGGNDCVAQPAGGNLQTLARVITLQDTRRFFMRKNWFALCAGLIFGTCQIPISIAADFIVTTDPAKTCSAIELRGEINVGDYNQFKIALGQAKRLAPLKRLYLNSGGGNILTTFAITEYVRNTAADIETIVPPGGFCNSACVILLTVGSRHNVSADAVVQVHQAFDAKTGERDPVITKEMGHYLALNGLPPDVMWTMQSLKSDEVLAVTPSNAKRLGFASFNFYGGINPPATPKCSWDGQILKGG